MTTDLSQIDDLLRRAKGEEGPPSTETGRLLREAANLFDIPRVHSFVNCDADEQAALHLMREALPDHAWARCPNGSIAIYEPDDRDRVGKIWRLVIEGVVGDSFARVLLIATLKAKKAMVEG